MIPWLPPEPVFPPVERALTEPYGLLAAGISVALIAVVNGLGTKLNTNFTSISTQLK